MENKKILKEFKIVRKVITTFVNFVLDGVKSLSIDKVTTTYDIKYEVKTIYDADGSIISVQKDPVNKTVVEEVVDNLFYELKQTNAEELKKYREKKLACFVLKKDGVVYYTRILRRINFMASGLLGAHICGLSGRECHRLSAAPDELGGCAKVRNHATYIERYPWIGTGYETFGTKNDSFVVVQCSHYKQCPPRPQKTLSEINKARLGLAQFVWDDVETIKDLNERRHERNKKKFKE